MFCFFFKQKTAYEMRISDWSSDVCSSDLRRAALRIARCARGWFPGPPAAARRSERQGQGGQTYRRQARPSREYQAQGAEAVTAPFRHPREGGGVDSRLKCNG